MLAAGSRLGRYRIEYELGSGGMGHVYAAEDTLLRRTVALKIVKQHSEEAAARLLREARAAAALQHPNAIAVYDVGETDGVAFIAMELVEGRTLASFIGEGAASIRQKMEWLLGMARALGAAHAEGIVHRDVKPDNVMVCADGSVKVLDFGIAKRAGQASAPRNSSGPPSFASAEGTVTGTPRYMAPEQLSGGALNGATDQFAWGIVAYELLSGVHPQTTTGTAERWGAPPKVLMAIAPTIDDELSRIVMRALERWPEHRWPSMEELVRALEMRAGIAPATPAPFEAGAALPAAPTMQLGDQEATTGAMEPLPAHARDVTTKPEVAVDPRALTTKPEREATDAGAAMTKPEVARATTPSVTLPQTIAARVSDPSRPTWRRLASPLAGFACIFGGFVGMLIEVFFVRMTNPDGADTAGAPDYAEWLMRVGWITLFVAPLTMIGRAPRAATVEAREGRVTIRGARGMSQSLAPSSIAGASGAPSGDGERFTVLILPRRGTVPITLDVPNEDAAHSLFAALGLPRAVHGTITWPLRRGGFDSLRLGVAITWRVAMLLTYIPLKIVLVAAFAITVLSGLLAMVFAFVPPTGPHVEMTDEQVRVFGQARRGAVVLDETTIALRDIVRVAVENDDIAIHLRSGDTLTFAAPVAQLSRRGMTALERAQLVAHMTAAADRARAAWS